MRLASHIFRRDLHKKEWECKLFKDFLEIQEISHQYLQLMCHLHKLRINLPVLIYMEFHTSSFPNY